MEIRYVNRDRNHSLYLYFSLSLLFIITWIYGTILEQQGTRVRQVGIDSFVLYLAGIFLVVMQPRIGFPHLLDRGVKASTRFLWPFCIGFVFGLADLFVFKILLHPQPFESLPSFLQPFPYSLFLYSQGAIYTEILYRLLPFGILLLLLEFFHPSGATRRVGFWFIAILTSLVEPIMQLPEEELWVKVYSFVTGLVFNLLLAWFFRRAGFLASLTMRLGHYLIWHILLGIYVEYVELP